MCVYACVCVRAYVWLLNACAPAYVCVYVSVHTCSVHIRVCVRACVCMREISGYSAESVCFFFQKAVALDPSDVVSLHSLGYW